MLGSLKGPLSVVSPPTFGIGSFSSFVRDQLQDFYVRTPFHIQIVSVSYHIGNVRCMIFRNVQNALHVYSID